MVQTGSPSLSKWHLLQTKPCQEARALEVLRAHQYTCFLPIHRSAKLKSDTLGVVAEPLFSRYLFIQLAQVENESRILQRLDGVSRLLKLNNRFATIPDGIISALLNLNHLQASDSRDSVAKGHGMSSVIEGLHSEPDGEARALTLLELICRPKSLVVASARLAQPA